MATALQVINKRVNALQKKHPKTKRTTLQKQAGREYRAGKLSGSKKRKKVTGHKRHVGKVTHRHKRRVGAASVNKSHKDVSDKKRVDITIGTVSSHLSAAKKGLVREIGEKEARKLTTHKKPAKKKLQKSINEKKALLRKLFP